MEDMARSDELLQLLKQYPWLAENLEDEDRTLTQSAKQQKLLLKKKQVAQEGLMGSHRAIDTAFAEIQAFGCSPRGLC